MLIHNQNFYDRFTGVKHNATITFETRRNYEVRVDGMFYSTAETKAEAFEELKDILKLTRWSPIKPF